jgi:hypothetical protein
MTDTSPFYDKLQLDEKLNQIAAYHTAVLNAFCQAQGISPYDCIMKQRPTPDGIEYSFIKKSEFYTNDGWVKVTCIEDLPQKRTARYEQYDCMVWRNGQCEHLVWNCEHLVWDERTGDDFECQWNDVEYYKLCEPPQHLQAEKNKKAFDDIGAATVTE